MINEQFKSWNSDIWEVSDGYSNGNPFNCMWDATEVEIIDANLKLTLTSKYSLRKADGSTPPYGGAELKSKAKYGYGKYEVSMKPAATPGVISSFFTYTGPSFGDPWDEIDVEFGYFGDHSKLRLQLNYYVNGVGGHEKVIDLPFDPAAAFHVYGFEWLPNIIEWTVDGNPVFAVSNPSAKHPSHPGKIMANIWPPLGLDDWAGHYDGQSAVAVYQWIKYTPAETAAPAPEPEPVVTPQVPDDVKADLKARFSYRGAPLEAADLLAQAQSLAEAIVLSVPAGGARTRSIDMLEDALLWAVAGISRKP